MNTVAPRVSVGLPVYNGERFIKEALDSLLTQTFENFELVISDNGSTDATTEICNSYAAQDPRIRFYRSEQNRGGSWNFRRVFDLSTAEYFRWHSYDDLCAPQLLERCVEVLDRMPSVILCYPRTMVIDENGQVLQQYTDDLNLRSPSPYQRYKHYYHHYREGAQCNVQYGLMRRSILGQTPLIAPYVNSDINLIGELALRGEFFEIPENLFLRRDHPAVSMRAFPTARERIVWFDPAKKGHGGHPGWRMFAEQIRAVKRAPMSWGDRVRCYLLTGRYFTWLAQGSIRNMLRGVQT